MSHFARHGDFYAVCQIYHRNLDVVKKGLIEGTLLAS
jgi:hypothetical protein